MSGKIVRLYLFDGFRIVNIREGNQHRQGIPQRDRYLFQPLRGGGPKLDRAASLAPAGSHEQRIDVAC